MHKERQSDFFHIINLTRVCHEGKAQHTYEGWRTIQLKNPKS